MRAITATPPTAMPTMAPVARPLLLLLEDEESLVGELEDVDVDVDDDDDNDAVGLLVALDEVAAAAFARKACLDTVRVTPVPWQLFWRVS